MRNATDLAIEQAVSVALSTRGREDPSLGFAAAREAAEGEGVTVYGYEIEGNTIRIWTEKPLEGTVFLAPIAALLSGESLTSPMILRKEAMRRVR